ncbi:glutamate racemase [Pirellulaceae bacterium SH467]
MFRDRNFRWVWWLLFCSLIDLSSGQVMAQATDDAKELGELRRFIDQVRESGGDGNDFRLSLDMLRRSPPENLPIGVFDSGIGGLTVLETILRLDAFDNKTAKPGADGIPDFQNETFIYLGDQANMPYGNYASSGRELFLRELIVRDAMFLLGNRYWSSKEAVEPSFDKPPVKAIVIACNTATAFGLEDIRNALRHWELDIPVIGVVEAGASTLVRELTSVESPGAVAVMATVGTCSSQAYPRAIARMAGQAGKRVPIVWQQGSVGLAGAIEGNPSFVLPPSQAGSDAKARQAEYQGPGPASVSAPLLQELAGVYDFEPSGILDSNSDTGDMRLNSVSNYVKYDVVTMVENYRRSGSESPIHSVILGCTHFPFEADAIRENLRRLRDWKSEEGTYPYRSILAEEIRLIDPAEWTAKELFVTLKKTGRNSKKAGLDRPRLEGMYWSVPSPTVREHCDAQGNLLSDYKYGRRVRSDREEDTRFVPLAPKELPGALAQLLREKCTNVWKELELLSRQTGVSE